MRLMASTKKTVLENLREWKVMILVLFFAPFLIVLMYLSYGGETTNYNMMVIDNDQTSTSQALIHALSDIRNLDDTVMFDIEVSDDDMMMKDKVKRKAVDIGLIIPEAYEETMKTIDVIGSLSNPRYGLAIIMTSDRIQSFTLEKKGIERPQYLHETFLEEKLPINEFDSMVPGLISVAILMIIFSCTATIVKEYDKLTIVRLKMSTLGAVNYLSSIGIIQALLATVGVALSYGTALALGYESIGDFHWIILIALFSSLSMIAVSLMMASYLRTLFDVLTIGCIPFFIMLFFSGGMMPIPKHVIFEFNNHGYGLQDLLPLTHTIEAFNKILNYGSGWHDISHDLLRLLLLTVVYSTMGVLIFKKRKLSA